MTQHVGGRLNGTEVRDRATAQNTEVKDGVQAPSELMARFKTITG
jgi:hypothetical protein